MLRSHTCGELRASDIGSRVELCGWVGKRREHGDQLVFVDLRDFSGSVQCVVDSKVDFRSEWVLKVTGIVKSRPDGTINPNIPTGEIEVSDCQIEILNTAEAPPLPLGTDGYDVDENNRLRFRFLDLRRERMQKNLRIRAKINAAIRSAFVRHGFVEVETPTLVPSTPEGAREFLVPSRQTPGAFYALPQSPQLFKQLLMVGGLDRYFQVVRCLRDEDLRADRQYEFTQLDMEMSFVDDPEDIFAFVSEAVLDAAEAVHGVRPAEIPRITWRESMDRFGVDKPDMRFGMELCDLSDTFAQTTFNAFASAPTIKGICATGQGELSRSKIDSLVDQAKSLGAKGLVWMRVIQGNSGIELDSPILKFLSETEISSLVKSFECKVGDLVLLVADEWTTACEVLGQLRNELGRPPVFEGEAKYVWITEFPLFVGVSDNGIPKPGHHPFTRPHPDDLQYLKSEPMRVRSMAYDLVLNGWELGSGSIRIHDPQLQQEIFSLLGISPEESQKRFGFFLNPFRYGAPPHGGFAFGIDRLAAILSGEENIREVIAFPKTQSGSDPMTQAPTSVSPAQLKELGIALLPHAK